MEKEDGFFLLECVLTEEDISQTFSNFNFGEKNNCDEDCVEHRNSIGAMPLGLVFSSVVLAINSNVSMINFFEQAVRFSVVFLLFFYSLSSTGRVWKQ